MLILGPFEKPWTGPQYFLLITGTSLKLVPVNFWFVFKYAAKLQLGLFPGILDKTKEKILADNASEKDFIEFKELNGVQLRSSKLWKSYILFSFRTKEIKLSIMEYQEIDMYQKILGSILGEKFTVSS